MPQRLRPECITCLLKQNLEAFPENATTDMKLEYMQRVLKLLAEAPKDFGAPVLVRNINDIQKEMFGFEKDFSEIKRYFNQVMLEKEAEIAENIQGAQKPLERAIQYTMVGNYIDFGTMNNVNENQLDTLLNEVEGYRVNSTEYAALKEDLTSAQSIVYITDNCGEIVLDKLFIKEIQRQFPKVKVTALVRGGAVLNDATMEDAVQVGLAEMTRVIGSGSNIAGTCLEMLSEEARQEIEQADVILAKGQANFETLRMCGMNIYYIFMCKCEMFAKEFQVPKFTGILVNDRHL